MKLFSLPLSPNSFKIVDLAHHLGLPLEVVPVDMLQGQHQSPALNPNGLILLALAQAIPPLGGMAEKS